jgi:hypothetical protein
MFEIEEYDSAFQSMITPRKGANGPGIFDEMLSLNQQKQLLKY